MRTWETFIRAKRGRFILVFLVEGEDDCDEILVGQRTEREVLVELEVGWSAWELRVDLRLAEPQVRADELGHGVEGGVGAHHVEVGVGHLDGRGDPTQGRSLGAVAGLDVEPGSAVEGLAVRSVVGAALLHPPFEHLPEVGSW